MCLAQVVEDDHWHLPELELSGGKQAPVAGDDSRVRIDEDGVVESELCDAGGNLRYLRIRVRAGIPRVEV